MDFRLKELRKERGLKQKDLATVLQVAPQSIGYYENLINKPDPEMLIKIADYFNVSIDYLLGREDDFGNISVMTNSDLTAEEKTMLELFNQLPDVRRRTIIDTMRFMVDSNRSSATQNKISNVKK